MPKQNGLREFSSVIADFRHLSSLAMKGVMITPAVIGAEQLAPPPGTSLVIVTTLLQFCCAVWIFQFWFSCNTSTLKSVMRIAGVCFVLFAGVCFCLTELYTKKVGDSATKVVIGYAVKPEIATILSPTFTTTDALRGSQYDPDRVWTRYSLLVMRSSVVGSWIITFLSLTTYFGTFILLQRKA
jgi:hypothetical protein